MYLIYCKKFAVNNCKHIYSIAMYFTILNFCLFWGTHVKHSVSLSSHSTVVFNGSYKSRTSELYDIFLFHTVSISEPKTQKWLFFNVYIFKVNCDIKPIFAVLDAPTACHTYLKYEKVIKTSIISVLVKKG